MTLVIQTECGLEIFVVRDVSFLKNLKKYEKVLRDTPSQKVGF